MSITAEQLQMAVDGANEAVKAVNDVAAAVLIAAGKENANPAPEVTKAVLDAVEKAKKNVKSLKALQAKLFPSTPLVQELLEYRATGSFPKPISCGTCGVVVTDSHVFFPDARQYLTYCTHTDWDGEEWCDRCVTVTLNHKDQPQISCTECAGLDFGRKTNEKVRFYGASSESQIGRSVRPRKAESRPRPY